ncbi:DUF2975 domain-containing protein [Pedobacter riviphilus]|uniref:DUF2975 domain-containing protein n=1 Tax=Pedobacter riviphilus TaxID=2766984 RepID=A0ABX6TJQ3_9SPHI|nr:MULTISPECIES: DUF2975 domain-containing protein [Pedobacter]NII81927.1 hypothetical protein [Pedobacter sp. SG908]NMN35930.1 hypothetical protein [Pedobacter sp. SG918]QNR85743.1 DUF2975 domain-containing protein [Pedobacter riviphilus]
MKTQNQIRLIKMGYVVTLSVVILFSLKDASKGFEEGYTDTGKGGLLDLVQGLFILIIVFFSSRVLVYLYRFINSIEIGNVFSIENTGRLTRMGWYCTMIPFLLFTYNAMVYANQSNNRQDIVFKIIENVDFQIWLLIFGLTLLTIAFVFRKGIELQQENDLTI